VGRVKGSLTQQQMKQTARTTIRIRRIYKTNSEMHRAALTTQCIACSRATINFPPTQLPHLEPGMTAHGIEHPVLFGRFESACQAVSPHGFW